MNKALFFLLVLCVVNYAMDEYFEMKNARTSFITGVRGLDRLAAKTRKRDGLAQKQADAIEYLYANNLQPLEFLK